LIAAIVIFGIACSKPEKRWIARWRSTFCSSVSSARTDASPIAVTSPPAQNPRPAPVSTMQPIAASSAQRSSAMIAPIDHRPRERVQAARAGSSSAPPRRRASRRTGRLFGWHPSSPLYWFAAKRRVQGRRCRPQFLAFPILKIKVSWPSQCGSESAHSLMMQQTDELQTSKNPRKQPALLEASLTCGQLRLPLAASRQLTRRLGQTGIQA
jgi:hypothetical protein